MANNTTYDGYAKANSEGSSPAVGTSESSSGLAVVPGTEGKHNRTVLSFDTSALPDDAVISAVRLTVMRSGNRSGDAWSNPAGHRLVIDIKTGCLGGCAIEAADRSLQIPLRMSRPSVLSPQGRIRRQASTQPGSPP